MRAKLSLGLVAIFLALSVVPMSLAQGADQDPSSPPPATGSEEIVEPDDPVPAVPSPAGTARQTVAAMQDATVESADAMTRGATGVAEQSEQLWHQALLPMWQRMAQAIPSLAKALLVLLIFWLVAMILGRVVRRLLQLTKIDDKAAKDWGLAGLLNQGEGAEPLSIAEVAGRLVKWTILLFGLVAFFQALDLNMVAEPLQNVAGSITGIIPSLLEALVILIAYWVVASLVKIGLTKLLTIAKFDQRSGKYLVKDVDDQEATSPTVTIGRLAFYLVLLFGLPPFLEALGQTALVRPLTAMLGKTLAFVPNIVAALILFLIGKMIATIVREVVSNFLAASGIDSRAKKLTQNLGSRRLSEIVGSVVYFFILVSVLVAAVDSLSISAIADPVKSTLERLLTAVPLMFVAVVVMFIGYAVARAVREVVEAFLKGIGFDRYPEQFGLSFLAPKEGRPALSATGGTVVMAIILLLTAEQALATLQLDQLSTMVGALIGYLPSLIAGVAMILVALALSGLASRLVGDALGEAPQARIAVPVVRVAIIFLGVSMGLAQLGVGEQIVMIAVAAALFGAALALGLSFGMGGRRKAEELIDQVSLPKT